MHRVYDPVWKAGPEPSKEPPPTWADNLEFADCELLAARRIRCDDVMDECRLQMARIDAALALIETARAQLQSKLARQ
jgi:hypothetical protein